MGSGRVGYLSGGPYEATVGEKKEPNKRPMRGRIVFGTSGLLFIMFTMLLLFRGFGNLENTTTELAEGARVRREALPVWVFSGATDVRIIVITHSLEAVFSQIRSLW